MWLFARHGLLTVVEDKDIPAGDTLIVRARVKEDMEEILGLHQKRVPEFVIPEITYHETFDYPYRVRLSKVQFGEVLMTQALDIDYRKFKDSVREEKRQGSERASIYTQVWSILTKIEPASRFMKYWDRYALTPTVNRQPLTRGSRTVRTSLGHGEFSRGGEVENGKPVHRPKNSRWRGR